MIGNRATRLITIYRAPLAALSAGVAVWAALGVLRPAPPQTVLVATAARDLPAGHVLDDSDVTVEPLPASVIPDASRLAPDEVPGRALAGPIGLGEPITTSRVQGPGLLTGADAGHVAMTVRIADAGSVGLLRAGDLVDVLSARQSVDPEGGQNPEADLVAQGARVLLVPQQDSSGLLGAGGDRRYDGSLVVLSVTRDDARQLAARGDAHLSVVLRAR